MDAIRSVAGFSLSILCLLGSPLYLCAQNPVALNKPAAALETAIPPVMTTAREARVRYMWYRDDSGTHKGGTSEMVVRVSPNPSGETTVSIGEEFAHGMGETSRATAWIAALCASHATDKLINDHEFLVRIGGFVDGPSAGMLLTATMIALIRGDAILPNVTMTGTINPDGSVGPVGGIPHKMMGAKESGMKRFGYPMGARICRDLNTKDLVDLQDRASEIGMEAVEIADVYDAYTLLTGKSLVRPAPVREDRMSISIALANRVRGAAKNLRSAATQRVQSLQRKAEALTDQASQKQRLQELAVSTGLINYSAQCEEEGAFAVALSYAEQADFSARVDELLWEMNQSARRGDGGRQFNLSNFTQVGLQQGQAAADKLDSLRMSLKSGMERSTVGGRVSALHSFANYWQGRAMLLAGIQSNTLLKEVGKELAARETQFAKAKGKASPAEAESFTALKGEYYNLATQMARQFALAQCKGDGAAYWSSFTEEIGKPATAPEEIYERLGRAYGSAASAGLSWFRALTVEQAAKRHQVTADRAERVMLSVEPDYPPILCAAQSAQNLAASEGETRERMTPLDQLASGVFAFHGAASLINKHYNFVVMKGPGGDARLGNRKALGRTLDLARQRVLEECGRVERLIGVIPDSVKLNYELANALRDGGDADRLLALKGYWRCVFLCDLARIISTDTRSARPTPAFDR